MTAEDRAPASEYDLELERRIFRKLAIRLLPLLVIGILVAYADRANLSVVKAPMSGELGLSAGAFGLAAGVFYLGYLFLEIPSNMAMQRFGARIWLARIMFTWGAATVALMFVSGPVSLNVLRFLLGAAEAGFYPGIVLYLTYWFPGRLFARAYSMFQLGVPIALAVTTLISSPMLLLDGTFGLAGWRWVFLLQGLPTIVVGCCFLLFLPDDPRKAKWLSTRECDYLMASVRADGASSHRRGALAKIVRSGLAWLYALLYFCMTLAFWTITYWLPTVIQERFGAGPVGSGLISAIPWGFCALVMLLIGISSSRLDERRWHIIMCLMLGGAGLFSSTLLDSPVLVLLSLCLAAAGSQAAAPLFWAQTSTVFAGAVSAVAIAFVNSLGNVSGFVGPYAIGVLSGITGNTRVGLVVMSVLFLVTSILTWLATRESVMDQGRAALRSEEAAV